MPRVLSLRGVSLADRTRQVRLLERIDSVEEQYARWYSRFWLDGRKTRGRYSRVCDNAAVCAFRVAIATVEGNASSIDLRSKYAGHLASADCRLEGVRYFYDSSLPTSLVVANFISSARTASPRTRLPISTSSPKIAPILSSRRRLHLLPSQKTPAKDLPVNNRGIHIGEFQYGRTSFPANIRDAGRAPQAR